MRVSIRNPFRLSSLAWVAIPLLACGFLIWSDVLRMQRVQYLSGIGEQAGTEAATPPSTQPGPAGWLPRLIVPGHDNTSYEWLDQTRQMFDRRELRVRHIDYENAPFGHDVDSASPYRWWLGAIAWIDHTVTDQPIGPALEQAALVADPLLHLLLVVAAAVFMAWQFGAFPAACVAGGLATVFPFAAGFLPGAPNDHGLVLICVFWSVLLLLPGIGAGNPGGRPQRWFFLAGIAGGLGLWLDLSIQMPVLAGIALGGLIAAWRARASAQGNLATKSLPWLAWALGGAGACLAAYMIEYFPDHLGSWQLRTVHPLYGLAWLGVGALLARTAAWIQGANRSGWGLRGTIVLVLSAAALATLPTAMWLTHQWDSLDTTLTSFQLTRISGGISAANIWAWLVQEQNISDMWATVLPVILVLPAGWLMLRQRTGVVFQMCLAVALGPALVAIGFSCLQLSWWNQVDGVLLALLAVTTAALCDPVNHRSFRWVLSGFLAVVCLLGAGQIFPSAEGGTTNALDETEIWGLVERDLARWLVLHTGNKDPVILAPNNQTITLHHFGGLRGLATLSRENMDGLGVAVRILSASTPEEAKELIDERGITDIVLPSWDSYLEVYTRMGMGKIDGTFYDQLVHWRLPTWLNPKAYQFPTIGGLEKQSVAILEVVDDQGDAAALSRIAEYFLEIGKLDQAATTVQNLRRFPADLGALTARAEVEFALGDKGDFDRIFESLLRRLSGGGDRVLPWDRRVGLAVVLARNKRADLARTQVSQCMAEVDEAKLRSLTTGSLYRFEVLGKAYGMQIADARLRQLALDLLPSDLRSRL
jgi:hypothetical protein